MPIRRDNDQDGESALHKACRYEHETIAQFLAEQMTREAIVALNRVSTMHSTSPNLESYSASVSLSLSLSLSLALHRYLLCLESDEQHSSGPHLESYSVSVFLIVFLSGTLPPLPLILRIAACAAVVISGDSLHCKSGAWRTTVMKWRSLSARVKRPSGLSWRQC